MDGFPAAGPCCSVGQSATIVAAGIAFSGGAPLFDFLFRSAISSTVTQCNAAQPLGTCELTDPCQQ
jgi:hypothetical protein